MSPTRILAAALLGIAAFALAACSPEPLPRIAIMTKLEDGSLVGSSEVNAARMAIEERGLDGRAVIEAYDDGWAPEKALAAWERLRADGVRFIVTSHVSTCAVALAERSAGEDVLVMIAGSATDALSGRDDENLRIIMDVRGEQAEAASWVLSRGYSSVLVARDTDNWAYTEPALAAFQAALGPGGPRLRVATLSIGALDAAALREELGREPFELLYVLVGAHNSAAGGVAQLGRLVEPDCAILFTPWMKTPAIVETAGDALRGAFMPAYYPARGRDARVDGYIDAFRRRYGYTPTYISLNVYAAVHMLIDRFEDGVVSPAAVKASVVGRRVDTPFGPVDFDEYGDARRPLYIIDDIAGEF